MLLFGDVFWLHLLLLLFVHLTVIHFYYMFLSPFLYILFSWFVHFIFFYCLFEFFCFCWICYCHWLILFLENLYYNFLSLYLLAFVFVIWSTHLSYLFALHVFNVIILCYYFFIFSFLSVGWMFTVMHLRFGWM